MAVKECDEGEHTENKNREKKQNLNLKKHQTSVSLKIKR